LGILKTDEKGMKDLFSKEYKRSLKLELKSKLNRQNKIMAANHGQLQFGGKVLTW